MAMRASKENQNADREPLGAGWFAPTSAFIPLEARPALRELIGILVTC